MRLHRVAWIAIAGTLAGSAYVVAASVHDRGGRAGYVSEAGRTPSASAPGTPAAGGSGAASALPADGSPSPGGRSPSSDAAQDLPTATAEGAMPGGSGAAGTGGGGGEALHPPGRRTTMHVPLNARPDDRARAAALGYDLFDVGPSAGEIDALPAGGRALVWVGNSTCSGFEVSYDEFTAAVSRLAGNPRVYGWYLSDEPNPAECPGIVSEIRRRADYIKAHAPAHKSFASLTDWPMRPLRPELSHLDLIGLDPYPCRLGRRCDMDAIDMMVRQALRAGFRRDMIVPVFQAFGQSCTSGQKAWRLPTAAELRTMMRRWARLAPRPAFDISYSWGRQAAWACPSLVDADGTGGHPDLQAIMKVHNLKR